jgi:uncharacterized protein YkwD
MEAPPSPELSMQHTLLALGCAFSLLAGSAFAQQQGGNDASMADKARQAAQTLGEKSKEAAGKMKDLAQEAAQKARAGADQNTADTRPGDRSSESQQMQKRADADHKAARAKCERVQPDAQRNVCEKQAAVAHANAELRIARAEAAAQGGKTSAMGAGKAAR